MTFLKMQQHHVLSFPRSRVSIGFEGHPSVRKLRGHTRSGRVKQFSMDPGDGWMTSSGAHLEIQTGVNL